jgi:hypothetical protein
VSVGASPEPDLEIVEIEGAVVAAAPYLFYGFLGKALYATVDESLELAAARPASYEDELLVGHD